MSHAQPAHARRIKSTDMVRIGRSEQQQSPCKVGEGRVLYCSAAYRTLTPPTPGASDVSLLDEVRSCLLDRGGSVLQAPSAYKEAEVDVPTLILLAPGVTIELTGTPLTLHYGHAIEVRAIGPAGATIDATAWFSGPRPAPLSKILRQR